MKRHSRHTAFRYHPLMPTVNAEGQRRALTFVTEPYKYFPDLALPAGHVKTTYVQRRCAIATYLCTNLACMCERTRRVGYPIPGSNPPRFRCYTNRQLIKRSNNIGVRCWQRAAASSRRYVHVDPRAKQKDEGLYEGFAAVRRVDESLWHRLGLHKEWVAACDQADKFLRSGAGDQKATAELIATGAIVPPAPTPPPQTDEERFAAAREKAMRLNAETLGKVRGNDTS